MVRARRSAVVLVAAVSAISGYGRAAQPDPPSFSFRNVARDAGIDFVTTFGGATNNTYLLETTGTGVAFIDYDGDGLLDLFFVNGTTLEGFPARKGPTNHLFRDAGNG